MNVIVMGGAGHVGLVTAACLASRGHQVTAVDINGTAIINIRKGQMPFFEPKLEDIVRAELGSGRLTIRQGLDLSPTCDVVVICVGTPTVVGAPARSLHSVDLGPLGDTFNEVVAQCRHRQARPLVAVRSTVPPAIFRDLELRAATAGVQLDIAAWPELLREGTAVHDFLCPPVVVFGVRERDAAARLGLLVKGTGHSVGPAPRVVTTPESAMLAKYGLNAMLATRVAVMNQLADLCEEHHGDVRALAKIIGADPRIGPHYLQAGPGFGGSCWDKDVTALATMLSRADEVEETNIFRAVVQSNDFRRDWYVRERVADLLGGDVTDKRIVLWGVSFKPDTSDIRNSPTGPTAAGLKHWGAQVVLVDPQGRLPTWDINHPTASGHLWTRGADAVVLMTPWEHFHKPNWHVIAKEMRGTLVLDCWGILDRAAVKAAGLNYVALGEG